MQNSITLYINSLLTLIGKSYMFYYWIPAISIYIFLLLLTISFYLRSEKEAPVDNVKIKLFYSPFFYVLIVSLSMILFRWPCLSYLQLNVDESKEIAGAMTLLSDPVFWRSVDGSTVGPIAYYVLLLPRLFGLSIDYGSTKLVGLILMIGSVLLLYGTFKNLFKDALARVAVLPVATFISLLSFFDYISYNGEHVTVFLLCSGLYVGSMLAISTPQKLGRLSFILGLILGSVPFAKLQGVPIALVIAFIGYLIIYVRATDGRAAIIRSMVYLTVGGLTMTILVYFLLLYFGIFHHFWNSYILANLYYTTHQFSEFTPQKDSYIDKLIHFPSFLFKPDESRGFFAGSLMAFISGIIFLVIYRKKISIFYKYIIGSAFLIILASIFSVIQPGYHFGHYLVFLFFPLAFLEGVFFCVFCSIATQKIQRFIVVIFLGVLLAFLAPQFYYETYRNHWKLFLFNHNMTKSDVSNKILSYSSPGEKMIIWGFASKYYVESGLIQGSRDAHTVRQIGNTPQQPYFLKRFIEDIKTSRAPVFIEALDGCLLRDKKTQSHDAFPEVYNLVNKLYREVAKINGVRIYISKERLSNLQ